MKTLGDIISKPYFTLQGNGKVIFKNGEKYDASFELRMLNNGKMDGDLDFISPKPELLLITHQDEVFTINAIIDEQNFIAKKCHITYSTQNTGEDFSIKLGFSPMSVVINEEYLESKNNKDLLVNFGLINVHQTYRVSVDTGLGKLTLSHYQGISDMEKLIKLHKISLITSQAQFSIPSSTRKTLKEIRDNSNDILINFLKITSIAQTTWHARSTLVIFEKKKDSDEYRRVYLELFSPKTKSPLSMGITNQAHSFILIPHLWKGYSKTLDEQYGFNLALDWYLDSWSADNVESQFLCATTCLELLMEKFYSQENSESLLNPKQYSELRSKFKECFTTHLKEFGVDAHLRKKFYDKLGGLNRKSYVDKAKTLVKFWGISIDDLDISLEDIVKIRNDITHRGQYLDNNSTDIFKSFHSLFMILTRIFLSMLKYEYDYWDFVRQKFVRFPEVCDKVNNPYGEQ